MNSVSSRFTLVRRTGLLLFAFLAAPGVSLGFLHDESAGGLASTAAHEVDGRDASLEQVIMSFLVQATVVRDNDEIWPLFCGRYSIDPNWPSAHFLGRVAREVIDEHTLRLQEAARDSGFVTADGRDPNDWRLEAMGKGFADVVERLRLDGFDLPVPVLISLIEKYNRGGTTYYSTEPGGAMLSPRKIDLFWSGAENLLPGLREEVHP